MADHVQQQILEQTKSALLAASTLAGLNIFLERVDELMETDLPAIHIEGGDEDVTARSIGHPVIQDRSYSFTTSCIGSGADCARTARNLAKQVEQALLTSAIPLSGKASTLQLEGSTVAKDGSGAIALFEVRQKWRATYYTQGGVPDAHI